MSITITNNGDRLKITNGTSVRNLLKSQVLDVTVIKSTIIKLDLGKGPLDNVFIDSAQVTNPFAPNAQILCDEITSMLAPPVANGGGGTSDASAANQQTQITQMNALTAVMNTLQNLSTSIDNKLFFQPLRVDESGPEISYKGYAQPASQDEQPVWAIQRTQRIGDVDVSTWANGTRDFNNVWTNRDHINYA